MPIELPGTHAPAGGGTGWTNTSAQLLLLQGFPARINGSGSSDRLCNARLCHFLFHFSGDGLAERSLVVIAWHDTIIMSCSESQERSI
jgi:hypothetical protein